MEADDLLCSRNARPQKALVGRAQWKINQPPSLERERASLEGACISFDARSRAPSGHPTEMTSLPVAGKGKVGECAQSRALPPPGPSSLARRLEGQRERTGWSE